MWGPGPAREASEEPAIRDCPPRLRSEIAATRRARWDRELLCDSCRAGDNQGGTEIAVPFPAHLNRAPVCRGFLRSGEGIQCHPEESHLVIDMCC